LVISAQTFGRPVCRWSNETENNQQKETNNRIDRQFGCSTGDSVSPASPLPTPVSPRPSPSHHPLHLPLLCHVTPQDDLVCYRNLVVPSRLQLRHCDSSCAITTLVVTSQLQCAITTAVTTPVHHHDSRCAIMTLVAPSRLQLCHHDCIKPLRLQLRQHNSSCTITTPVAPSRPQLRHHNSSCAIATPIAPSRPQLHNHNFSCAITTSVAPSRLQLRHHNSGCAITIPAAPSQLQLRYQRCGSSAGEIGSLEGGQRQCGGPGRIGTGRVTAADENYTKVFCN
jgi:hypothetical protein